MLRRLGLVSAALLVVTGSVPLAFGQLSRWRFDGFVAGLQRGAEGRLRVETISYDRGLLRSTAVTRLTSDDLFETKLLVEYQIEHGPLSASGEPIVTLISGQAWPEDPEKRESLERPLFELEVDAPLLGPAVRCDLSMPELASNDGRLSFAGLEGSVEVDRFSKLGRGQLEFRGMRLKDKQEGSLLRLGPFTASADFDFSDEDSPLRGFDMLMKGFAIRNAAREPMLELGPIQVSGHSFAMGRLMGDDLKLEVGFVRVDGLDYGRIAFEAEARNLDPSGLEALRALSDNQDPDRAPALGELQRIAADMASHSPSLHIKRLELEGPEGELQLQGHVGLDGKRYVAAGALRGALSARADLRVTESLAIRALESFGAEAARAEAPAIPPRPLLNALIDSGYLRRANGLLQLRLEYRGGALKLNGQPFVPQALMAELTGSQPRRGAVAGPYRPAQPRLHSAPLRGRLRSLPASASRPADKAELDEMRRQMGMR